MLSSTVGRVTAGATRAGGSALMPRRPRDDHRIAQFAHDLPVLAQRARDDANRACPRPAPRSRASPADRAAERAAEQAPNAWTARAHDGERSGRIRIGWHRDVDDEPRGACSGSRPCGSRRSGCNARGLRDHAASSRAHLTCSTTVPVTAATVTVVADRDLVSRTRMNTPVRTVPDQAPGAPKPGATSQRFGAGDEQGGRRRLRTSSASTTLGSEHGDVGQRSLSTVLTVDPRAS